jgi:hypothetical protein
MPKQLNKCLHDIRNTKTLDKEMINKIRNMPDKDKMIIIVLFNDMIEAVNIALN